MNIVFSRFYKEDNGEKVYFQIAKVLQEMVREFSIKDGSFVVELTHPLYFKFYKEYHSEKDFKSNFTFEKKMQIHLLGHTVIIREVYNDNQRDNEIVIKTVQ